MSTITKARRPVKPVSGTCKWIAPMNCYGQGLLEVNEVPYTVYQLRDKNKVVGHTLTNLDNGKSYDVDEKCEECTCPDSVYRRRPCKHAKALQAALSVARKVA